MALALLGKGEAAIFKGNFFTVRNWSGCGLEEKEQKSIQKEKECVYS